MCCMHKSDLMVWAPDVQKTPVAQIFATVEFLITRVHAYGYSCSRNCNLQSNNNDNNWESKCVLLWNRF